MPTLLGKLKLEVNRTSSNQLQQTDHAHHKNILTDNEMK